MKNSTNENENLPFPPYAEKEEFIERLTRLIENRKIDGMPMAIVPIKTDWMQIVEKDTFGSRIAQRFERVHYTDKNQKAIIRNFYDACRQLGLPIR